MNLQIYRIKQLDYLQENIDLAALRIFLPKQFKKHQLTNYRLQTTEQEKYVKNIFLDSMPQCLLQQEKSVIVTYVEASYGLVTGYLLPSSASTELNFNFNLG